MKRVHIIGGPDTTAEEFQARVEFTRQAWGADVTDQLALSYCRIDQVVYIAQAGQVRVIDGLHDKELADYDLVWFRGRFASVATELATIASYLTNKGIKNINTYYSLRRGVDKINQLYMLATLKLPIPDTVSSTSAVLPKYVEQFLDYPIIVKDAHGSHGEKNYLVYSESELIDVLRGNPDTRFMAQAWIQNDGDYRILLAGHTPLIIHRRATGDSHLNNTSQSAQASLVGEAEFSAQIIQQSCQFADASGYEIAGVDVIIDRQSGQHYFLEINSQPQVVSGVFIAEKQRLIGDYFHDLLRD